MSCFDNSAEDKWKARSIPNYDEEPRVCPWCGNKLKDTEMGTEIDDEYYHDKCVEEMEEEDYLDDEEDEE